MLHRESVNMKDGRSIVIDWNSAHRVESTVGCVLSLFTMLYYSITTSSDRQLTPD